MATDDDAVEPGATPRRVWLSVALLAGTLGLMLAPPAVAVLAWLGVVG